MLCFWISITEVLFTSCEMPKPEPSPPILDLSGEVCSIKYGTNVYKASVTHIFQGVTSITFSEPSEAEGLIYSFSGNGCDVKLGDLTFNTESSFMSDSSLPQVLNDIFESAQKEGALTFMDSEEPKASTLTTATFCGRTNYFTYELITDYDSGYIREINADNVQLKVRLAGK